MRPHYALERERNPDYGYVYNGGSPSILRAARIFADGSVTGEFMDGLVIPRMPQCTTKLWYNPEKKSWFFGTEVFTRVDGAFKRLSNMEEIVPELVIVAATYLRVVSWGESPVALSVS